MNWFKVALSKLGGAFKFVGVSLWKGAKAVFGSEQARNIGLAALKSAQELLKTEVGQFGKQVVEELEQSTLSGPERLAQATANIGAYLAERGQAMPTLWTHWAVQSLLLVVRGAVAAVTDDKKDSDGDGVPDDQDTFPLDPARQ